MIQSNPTNKILRLCVRGLVLVTAAASLNAPSASAQDSSLLHARRSVRAAPPLRVAQNGASVNAGVTRQDGYLPPRAPTASGAPLTLQSTSWTYRPEPKLRTFQKNDIITIRVDEIARVLAEGEAESRKQTAFEAILTDWVRIVHGSIRPDPQDDGDPAVAAQSNNRFRSEATVESRESMTFNIAAEVVDIRPNGNLVLEARKSFRVNDNLWETSLSGTCRVQDIGPDNVLLSRDLLHLEIRKEDQGHLRDGYRRGWFSRWLDRFQPF